MNMLRVVACCVALSALGGCANRIAESDCRATDWSDRGYRDALKGLEARAEALQQACAAFGKAVDTASYAQGFEEGLDEFCSSDYAYDYGERGGSYRGTCPGALHSAFMNAYDAGRVVGAIERQLDSLEREIQDLLYQLDNPNTSREQYYYLRERVRTLESEQQRLHQQLARLRR